MLLNNSSCAAVSRDHIQRVELLQISPTILRAHLRTAFGTNPEPVWRSVESEALRRKCRLASITVNDDDDDDAPRDDGGSGLRSHRIRSLDTRSLGNTCGSRRCNSERHTSTCTAAARDSTRRKRESRSCKPAGRSNVPIHTLDGRIRTLRSRRGSARDDGVRGDGGGAEPGQALPRRTPPVPQPMRREQTCVSSHTSLGSQEPNSAGAIPPPG